MTTFDDLVSSFEEGKTVDFIQLSAKLKSVNDTQDGEPLLVYLTRLLGEDESPGKEDIFRHLVSEGAKLDVQDDRGRTPLSNLAFNNNLHYFKLLVELGADINFAGDEGAPIKRAIRSNSSIEVANFIFSNPKYVPLPNGVLSDVAKRSGAKKSTALLKELKIK
jgi:ankyrin repeat protein